MQDHRTQTYIKERNTLPSQYSNLTVDRTAYLLLKTGSTLFEHGEKAGKLLVHQLRQSAATNQILKILTLSGTTIDPKEINNECTCYFEY